MTTIYKYHIAITDKQELIIPFGSKILTVQMQGNRACIWAIVDTEEERIVIRKIEVVGTGNTFDTNNKIYIGTIQHGSFVWHVFESN